MNYEVKSYYRFELSNSRIVWILTILTILCAIPERAIAEGIKSKGAAIRDTASRKGDSVRCMQEAEEAEQRLKPHVAGGEMLLQLGNASDLIAQGVRFDVSEFEW